MLHSISVFEQLDDFFVSSLFCQIEGSPSEIITSVRFDVGVLQQEFDNAFMSVASSNCHGGDTPAVTQIDFNVSGP